MRSRSPFLPTNPADVCTQMEVVLRKGLLDRRLASNIGRRIVVHVKRQKHPWVGYLLKQTWIWLSYNWYVYIYNIYIYIYMYIYMYVCIYIYIYQTNRKQLNPCFLASEISPPSGHRWNWGAPATAARSGGARLELGSRDLGVVEMRPKTTWF